jgi:alkyl sulfatase BDS1-like metallo-beta-lactamase superfamily hydrolase
MGCGVEPTPIQVSTGSQGNSAPTPSTLAMNQGVAASLDLKDPQDFNDARRAQRYGTSATMTLFMEMRLQALIPACGDKSD